MTQTFNRLNADAEFDAVDSRTRPARAVRRSGVLNKIDLRARRKMTLDVEMPPSRILRAGTPKLAYPAIERETRGEARRFCTVTLRAAAGGVSGIDPDAAMPVLGNRALRAVAGQVRHLQGQAIAWR